MRDAKCRSASWHSANGASAPKHRITAFFSRFFLTLMWYGNTRAGMEPDPVKAGIGGLVVLSLVVAWAYWMNRARPARA